MSPDKIQSPEKRYRSAHKRGHDGSKIKFVENISGNSDALRLFGFEIDYWTEQGPCLHRPKRMFLHRPYSEVFEDAP